MTILTLMRTAELELRGLGAGAGPRGVCSALQCIHGVAQVRMVPDECRARVTYDAFKVFPHQFQAAVSAMGCEIERLMIVPEWTRAPDALTGAGVGAEAPDRREFTLT